MSYIIIRVYSFECDRDGCDETEEIVGPRRGMWGAMHDLREAGWDVRRGVQYCPAHHRGGESR